MQGSGKQLQQVVACGLRWAIGRRQHAAIPRVLLLAGVLLVPLYGGAQALAVDRADSAKQAVGLDEVQRVVRPTLLAAQEADTNSITNSSPLILRSVAAGEPPRQQRAAEGSDNASEHGQQICEREHRPEYGVVIVLLFMNAALWMIAFRGVGRR